MKTFEQTLGVVVKAISSGDAPAIRAQLAPRASLAGVHESCVLEDTVDAWGRWLEDLFETMARDDVSVRLSVEDASVVCGQQHGYGIAQVAVVVGFGGRTSRSRAPVTFRCQRIAGAWRLVHLDVSGAVHAWVGSGQSPTFV